MIRKHKGGRIVYGVNIGNFDLTPEDMERSLLILDWAQANLYGYIGMHPNMPHGLMLLFRTKEDAELAIEALNKQGVKTYGEPECGVID